MDGPKSQHKYLGAYLCWLVSWKKILLKISNDRYEKRSYFADNSY